VRLLTLLLLCLPHGRLPADISYVPLRTGGRLPTLLHHHIHFFTSSYWGAGWFGWEEEKRTK
jgi:hypothetical protein